ncbi:BTB/POZ domain-containing protein 6-A-like [Lutzomyia longipalpis]|uniref:BTB/POZ domain-containing protein 6-A-like n=1 Tax=Lutzomyia longipalpis TaxID=7200 RepID=UPI002483FCEE|nr:BTB/POZ domain-containing protein 6-A-like [Lutzomyia longipalpis]
MATMANNNAALPPFTFGKSPDVTFIFLADGGEKLQAEKLKLAQISEVFNMQFYGEFGCSEEITIKDITFDTFKTTMEFLYGIEITITAKNFEEILYMASKYFIFDLIGKVIGFVDTFLNENNLLDHYETLEKYQIEKLNHRMQEICEKFPLKIIERLTDSKVHMGILKKILESPILNIAKEYDLYAAVAAMMQRTSQNVVKIGEEMRKKIGKLIYFIRFPLMSVDELILCGQAPSLLTDRQFLDLLYLVKSGKYNESVQFFSMKQRYYPKVENCSHCKKGVTKRYCQACGKYF